jgi:hypothetical protein
VKKIDSLVFDIHQYLKGNFSHEGGGASVATEERVVTLAKNIANHTLDLSAQRPVVPKDSTDRMIRMSELGEPCLRKLTYKWYHPHRGLPPFALPNEATLPVKFLLGDYVEEVALFLAGEAGHDVTDRQETVEIRVPGVSWYALGHTDATIDGHVIDVKSASDFAFNKYKREGMSLENDSFGYRFQIDGYATAKGTSNRGFLFVNKHDGELLLLDRSNEPLIDIETRIKDIGQTMSQYIDEGDGPDRLPLSDYKKTSEKKLCTVCSYCQFKHHCWSGPGVNLEGWVVSGRPQWFVNLSDEGRKDLGKTATPIPTP